MHVLSFPGGTSGEEPACASGGLRNAGSIPGWEDLLEEGRASRSSILAGESHGQRTRQPVVQGSHRVD